MYQRLARLLIGLVLYGIAAAIIVRAAIGVDPWTVLAQGVAIHTGQSLGIITIPIGLLAMLLWIPLRQKPGLGTILNILIVGPAIDLGLWLVPAVNGLWAQVPLFALGLVLLAVASGLYISADMGPGPRDGLMLGIHRRTGWPIWVGRSGVEITVLVIGWILGGNVGVGTLAFAVLIGPLCNITIPLLARRPVRAQNLLATSEALPHS